MDTRAIEEFITPRTKALAVVHYLGVLRMEKLKIAQKRIVFVEDRPPERVSMEFTLGLLAMQVASRSIGQALTTAEGYDHTKG